MSTLEKSILSTDGVSNFQKIFIGLREQTLSRSDVKFSGTVTGYDGQVIESSTFPASIGSECTIKSRYGT